jgi:hypothetical protein
MRNGVTCVPEETRKRDQGSSVKNVMWDCKTIFQAISQKTTILKCIHLKKREHTKCK